MHHIIPNKPRNNCLNVLRIFSMQFCNDLKSNYLVIKHARRTKTEQCLASCETYLIKGAKTFYLARIEFGLNQTD